MDDDPISQLCREIESTLPNYEDEQQAEEEQVNGVVAAWWLWWLN